MNAGRSIEISAWSVIDHLLFCYNLVSRLFVTVDNLLEGFIYTELATFYY
jgi:hypothetical protein